MHMLDIPDSSETVISVSQHSTGHLYVSSLILIFEYVESAGYNNSISLSQGYYYSMRMGSSQTCSELEASFLTLSSSRVKCFGVITRDQYRSSSAMCLISDESN